MAGYFQSNIKQIQEKALMGIDNLIEILEAPINMVDIKENKLQNACESKKEALTSINYISNRSNLIGKRKEQIIRALENAFDTLIDVVAYQFQIKDSEVSKNKEQSDFEIVGGLASDLQKSVSRAKKIAFEIVISISETIDQLREDEKLKEQKVQNIKKPSIQERIMGEIKGAKYRKKI